MGDVKVAQQNWYRLKKSANCFVPALLAQNSDMKNVDLHAYGPKTDGFSVQLIGKIMRLEAVSHEKAQQCVDAYVGFQATHSQFEPPPTPSDQMIVVAAFATPRLSEFMEASGHDPVSLSDKSAVSVGAIEHLLSQGRAPGGVVEALRKALGISRLDELCTSAVGSGAAGTSVKGAPFTLDDLQLPLPAESPLRWP